MKKPYAVFTMVKNEAKFLPLWIKYYSQFGTRNLYILNHNSTDGSIESIVENNPNLNIELVEHDFIHDNNWMLNVWTKKQKELLEEYEYVITSDVDEFIIPDPNKYINLYHYVFIMMMNNKDSVCCTGYEVVHQRHEELNHLNWDKPILVYQRKYWIRLDSYDKPYIASRPINWSQGRHFEVSDTRKTVRQGRESIPRDDDLILCHLHRVDFEYCKDATEKQAEGRYHAGTQEQLPNLWVGERFINYFDRPGQEMWGASPNELTEIPEKFGWIL